MKKPLILTALAVFAASWLFYMLFHGGPSVWGTFKHPETERMLKQFVALKEKQAHNGINEVPPELEALFEPAKRGQWLTFSNALWKAGVKDGDFYKPPTVHGKIWQMAAEFISDMEEKIGWHGFSAEKPHEFWWLSWGAVNDINGAFKAFATGDEEYSTEFGRDIIDSIPPGSVYFGGTDPGQLIVTMMCRSQPEGDPFFTLSQNELRVPAYLDHVRSMYGGKIYVPTQKDITACFDESWQRVRTNTTSDSYDVMNINSLLAKVIFDRCPTNEFYVEEQFRMDWACPYLEPHGLIFKLNRQPLAELSDEVIRRDREYWRKSLAPKIGDWLGEETKIEAIADFARRIFSKRDFKGFAGDPQFVQNDYACRMFSKERANIAGLYDWRVRHAGSDDEKRRMSREADFAFRQAWALCPYSAEVIYPYINFLLAQNRIDDAVLVAETAASLPQLKDEESMGETVARLKQWRAEHPAASGD